MFQQKGFWTFYAMYVVTVAQGNTTVSTAATVTSSASPYQRDHFYSILHINIFFFYIRKKYGQICMKNDRKQRFILQSVCDIFFCISIYLFIDLQTLNIILTFALHVFVFFLLLPWFLIIYFQIFRFFVFL